MVAFVVTELNRNKGRKLTHGKKYFKFTDFNITCLFGYKGY